MTAESKRPAQDATAETDHVITVGIIAPPGTAARHAEALGTKLPELLNQYVDTQVRWRAEALTDPLAGVGDELSMLDETEHIVHRNGWDLGVCLIDLPVYRHAGTPGRTGRLVVGDVSYHRGIAGLSLPPLGVWALRGRLRQAILRLIAELHTGSASSQPGDREQMSAKDTDRNGDQGDHADDAEPESPDEDQSEDEQTAEQRSPTAGPLMTKRTTNITVPTKRRQHELERGVDTRFISPNGRGHLRLWAAMIAQNRPWALFHNFTAVIAVAFATGAYGLIFQSVYYLTDYFGYGRLIVVMLLAMTAMVTWIIASHHLWEPLKPSRRLPMAPLYNWITVLTLSVAVLLTYAALYLLLLLAAVLFVPSAYLESTLGHAVGPGRYPLLAWIAASIATLAGALGAGLESDEAVRHATFGGRQQQRQQLIRSQRENESTDAQHETGSRR